jgi:hypothetical protein
VLSSNRLGFCRFLVLVLCLTAPSLLAQSTQSTILGTVTDKSGAVIPRAEVVVTNVDKGESSTYWTDASGNYLAPELLPGTYTVRVTKAGFEAQLIQGLQLDARQQLRADATLDVGKARQEIVVNAEFAGAIETETASISSSLSGQNVSNLPVNYYGSGGTSPLNIIQALPGVQSDTASGTASPSANGTTSMSFSVQGGQPFQTEASVDGISTQNVRYNTPLADAFPSAESIAEMRVDGVNNNAEFGQAGEITAVSKSGTNQYHGAAFWHFQNSALDAMTFGETTKPYKNGNDYGVSVGGPATIPHLYNGHDRTFFYTTYEGFLFPKQSTIQDMVPTARMLSGDFSVESPSYPLLNPATESCYFSTGNPLCGAYLSPFNQITNISASAKPFLTYFPTPNYPVSSPYTTIAAAQAGAGYNYTANRANDYDTNQFDARIDHHFSSKMLGFVRYTFKNITLLEPQDLNIASITQFDNYRILASSLIYNFTPNLVNEFRFGFTVENNGLRNTLNGAPITTAAGFDPVSASLPVNDTTGTEIYFTSGLTSLLAGNINQTTQSHLFQYNDNLTWVRGQHTVKFGGDIRALQSISTLGNNGLNTAEVFAFYGLYTSGYQGAFLGTSLNGVAYQFADFLTGAPVETQYYSLVPRDDGAAAYYAFFGQDQWKIAPRLTLSFGVRYEYDPAMHDTTGTIGNFNPAIATTGAVIYPAGFSNMLDAPYLAQFDACGYGPATTAYAACTPVLSNSQAGVPSGLRNAQKDRILPRVGLAWRPFNDDKTAVRAGFGVYNTVLLGDSFFAMTDTLQAATLTYNNLEGAPYYPPYMWPVTSPGSGTITPAYGSANFTSANQIGWKNPYSMQWDLSLDRELKGNIGARISYIGMKTDDLVWAGDENVMPYSSTTKARSQPLTNRPFPNWGAIIDRLNGAQAIYNALQAEANRRFQNGLTFQSTYSWAKNLADNQGTQAGSFVGENGNYASYIHNLGLDYGNVYGTRRQRWITTGMYELPLGRGRTFGTNMNRGADAVVGGWQLSSIFLWQTGPYLTAYIPGGDADPSGTGAGALYPTNQRPDMAGQIVPANRTRAQWLNPSAFACPSNTAYTAGSYAGHSCGVGVTSNPIGRFGNESVGNILGPGTVNLSAGLRKQFVITENVHLSAEGTFTNVLNHTNLNDPILDITNVDFGRITTARGSDFGAGRTGQVAMKLEF